MITEHVELDAVKSLSNAELLARYAIGVEGFDRRVVNLTDAQLDTAFRPEAGVGRWPARVLLGHLADAEMLFVHRLRRIVGEDQPVFAIWDEEAFIDSGIYGRPPGAGVGSAARDEAKHPAHSVGAFIAVIFSLRKWTHDWIAALPESAWSRIGLHPERGEQKFRTVGEYAVWHLEHHAWYLNRKVEKLLA